MTIDAIKKGIATLEPIYVVDENAEPHAILKIKEKIMAIPIKSEKFEKAVKYHIYKNCGCNVKNETFKDFRQLCEFEAEDSNVIVELPLRVGWDKDRINIIYNLRTVDGKQVKISANGWEVCQNEMLFRDYGSAARVPQKGGNISLIEKYFNIEDPKQKLLTEVTFISYFVPGISHPILVLSGEHGAGKTTDEKVIKRLVDPSTIDVADIVNCDRTLELVLEQNLVIPFDNLSSLSPEESDRFCRTVTGYTVTRRFLFKDDALRTRKINRCIILGGINSVAKNPGILDRSVLVELKRIPEEDRNYDVELFKMLDDEAPYITGAIFDIVSSALRIFKGVKDDARFGRLKDFGKIGFAIAESMGGKGEEFLEALKENRDILAEEIREANVLAVPIISYLKTLELPLDEKAADFFDEFYAFACEKYNSHITKKLPQRANVFSRDVKPLLDNIKSEGFVFDFYRDQNSRYFKVKKVEEKAAVKDHSVKNSETASTSGI